MGDLAVWECRENKNNKKHKAKSKFEFIKIVKIKANQ